MKIRRHHLRQAVRGLAIFSAVIGLAHTGLAHAGSFNVNPVRITLSAKQPVAAITVRNSGNEPSVVQLEASAWTQDQGKDVLTPNADLLATPPIFTVPAGGTQIIRVGLRNPRASTSEVTYRLILREVPSAAPKEGVRVALLISMPVFVVPATPIKPELTWKAMRTADGKVRVTATNTGTAHVQLGKLDLSAGAGPLLGSRGISEYVLPGNTKSWVVDAAPTLAAAASVQILSSSDAGDLKSTVPLETGLVANQDVRATR